MTDFVIPSDEGVQQMITMVVGDEASVDQTADSMWDGFGHIAQFVDDDDEVVGLCLADMPLSAALGAGLSMIPPAAAHEMVEEQELTPIARDNLYEVMNMLSSLFMNDQTPHLKLSTVEPRDEGEDDPGKNLLTENEFSRVDFLIEAGKYGRGRLTFYAT